MNRKIIALVMIGVLSLLVLGLGVWLWPRQATKVVIPQSISQQFNFQPLITATSTSAQASEVSKTLKYDSQNKVLSFVTVVDNKHVAITEQAYPEVLVFDSVVNSFNVYSTLDLKVGTVYLGHPDNKPDGNQAAVMRTDTLLIFGRPAGQNLSDNQWRTVFDNLAPPAPH